MIKRIAVLLWIAVLPVGAQESPAEITDRTFAAWAKGDSPGCSLGVLKDGRILYEKAYGMADLDHAAPLTPSTVFHVESISKQFTAAATVLLVQDGKLSLDDNLRKHIPEMPDFGSPITIRHLIHHTSGLREYLQLWSYTGWRWADVLTDADVLYILSRQHGRNFAPGEKYLYTNTDYALLGEIVRRVSGKSLREFLAERIFGPLGMKGSHLQADSSEVVNGHAVGYAPVPGGGFLVAASNQDRMGASSVLTTVEDLALWDENFYTARVGGPAFVRQMLERGRLNDGREVAYGAGLEFGEYRGLSTVDHSGSYGGYRADLLRFPDQHFSVACLCNVSAANAEDLARRVADVYLAGLLRPVGGQRRETAGETAAANASGYAGLYWNKEHETYRRFAFEAGKLRLVTAAGRRADLEPMRRGEFALGNLRLHFSISAATHRPHLSISHADTSDVEELDARDEFHPAPDQLLHFAGTYWSGEIDTVYRLRVDGKDLVLTRLRHEPEKLVPIIQDVFRASMGTIRFTRGAERQVDGFLLSGPAVIRLRFDSMH